MKCAIIFCLFNTICTSVFCQHKGISGDKIPDSINAIAYYAEIKITKTNAKINDELYGIIANEASVGMSFNKEQKVIKLSFFDYPGKYVAIGKDVYRYGPGYVWNYDWKESETYPLLIATASDSASNKTVYSGYIYLPAEKKWKLIATRSYDDTIGVKYFGNSFNKKSLTTFSNRWVQRSNGTWKALDSQTTKPPSLRQMSNIDSVVQQQLEETLLRSKLPKDSIAYEAGIFYQTLKEGTGQFVKVTDTLTVHYRGSLFNDGVMFDETKDKPATFPLERLIKGWQTGLVHCKVGGKMRLYLPSGSAYGIRTRAATIPPNSILVFDVEVLDAKEKIIK